ncbi:hypothetical protein HPB58_21110 [Priestia filamentosa]|uniref:MerR family transcriptional regulator n=1 Tax=Priestia filamentosa TaxID=1402861 RepID=UPI001FB1F816|nr:MerR family transcriptional regulator [Priestia filamentosa]MED3726790.1 hypothetical protein [Priestia filamentosa]UOE59793.1 hypothetical protein HPB58_21110 [Priestia filamentosa]
MKTHEAARELGVSSQTVIKWIRHYNIDCAKNERGHFDISKENIKQIREAHNIQPRSSARKGHVQSSTDFDALEAQIQEMCKQMGSMMGRIAENDRRIEEKAGEVVTFQVLEHRTEITNLQKKIYELEERLAMVEEQLEKKEGFIANKKLPRWKTLFMNLWSL